MKYQVVENGVVVNTVVSDSALFTNWIQNDTAGIGWTYENGVFSAPVVVSAPVRVLTKLQYMNRFKDAELAAIYTSAKSVVAVEIWLEKFKLATEINLDDDATVSGLQAMKDAGLLTVGRASEILA